MVRRFESAWEEAFATGQDPGLIPVPTFKIADLAQIIRYCPVIQQSSGGKFSRRFDGKWLLRNVGSRFFNIYGSRGFRAPLKAHLIHPNIAQHHLGCADDLWESIAPRGQQASYPWPSYFAPVSDLMWARHTLHALSNQNSAQEPGHVLPSLFDEMWLALASIAPRFVRALHQISWSIDQVIGMMATPILDGQKEALGAVLQGLSLPCPGTPLPQRPLPAPLVLKDKGKLWHGIANIRFGGAFPGPPASLDEYPDIVDALSEVWHNKKPLAVITAALIYQLLQNEDRVHPSANRDILSVVDVVSVMPKHQMTRTALYKFCEARSINYANASVVSLMWIESWIKNQIDADLLHKLDGYFTLKAGEKFTLVYLIPPSSGPAQAIAICSVTVSY